MVKDFHFTAKGIRCLIKNVPYEEFDTEGEELVDLDVAIKLEMIRELMVLGKIPNIVDYREVDDSEI